MLNVRKHSRLACQDVEMTRFWTCMPSCGGDQNLGQCSRRTGPQNLHWMQSGQLKPSCLTRHLWRKKIHTHTHTHTHGLVLVLVLAPLPDTGHMVSFCKEAKPDGTSQLETTLNVEQPVKAIPSDLAPMGEIFTHPCARHTTASETDGAQPGVTAPCIHPGL